MSGKKIFSLFVLFLMVSLAGCSVSDRIVATERVEGKDDGTAVSDSHTEQFNKGTSVDISKEVDLLQYSQNSQPTGNEEPIVAAKCRIKSTKIYKDRKSAGLEGQDDLFNVTDNPIMLYNARELEDNAIYSYPFVLISLELTDIEWEDPNVTVFGLAVFDQNNEAAAYCPMPDYYSAAVVDSTREFYHLDIQPGETRIFQIGYFIDTKVMNPDDLYLWINPLSDKKIVRSVPLGLNA